MLKTRSLSARLYIRSALGAPRKTLRTIRPTLPWENIKLSSFISTVHLTYQQPDRGFATTVKVSNLTCYGIFVKLSFAYWAVQVGITISAYHPCGIFSIWLQTPQSHWRPTSENLALQLYASRRPGQVLYHFLPFCADWLDPEFQASTELGVYHFQMLKTRPNVR